MHGQLNVYFNVHVHCPVGYYPRTQAVHTRILHVLKCFLRSHPALAALAKFKPALAPHTLTTNPPVPHCFRPKPAPVAVSENHLKTHAMCFIASGNLLSGSVHSRLLQNTAK